MKPQVSVVIPTFNHGKHIAVALNSLLTQDDIAAEIIVVNDGSTDATHDIVLSYGPLVRYIYQPNSGLARARNTGLYEASGDHILFLDADDALLPGALAALYNAAISSHPCHCIYSRWRVVEVSEDKRHDDGANLAPYTRETLLYTNIGPIHSFLFQTSALRSLGGFAEAVPGCEDWDLLIRLAWGGASFIFMPMVTAVYCRHQGSMSSNCHTMLQSGLTVLEQAFCSTSVPAGLRILRHVGCALQYVEAASRRVLEGNNSRAETYLIAAYRHCLFVENRAGCVPCNLSASIVSSAGHVLEEALDVVGCRRIQKTLRDWARDGLRRGSIRAEI